MGKPGIMLYFELRPCIQQMNQQEKAEMLDAMMDYGEFGRTPELSEKLRMLWPLIQLKLDRDSDRYDRTVKSKQYAVYVRENRKKGTQTLDYDQWERALHQNGPDMTGDHQQCTSDIQTTNYKPQTTNCKQQTTTMEPAAAPACFSPPKKEMISAYCREMGYSMDADSFLDYYSANGWMIGKSPMKDWKAAVRRWNRKENRDGAAEKLSEWTVGEVL